ncbi:4715_t:CDS:2 [Diversispora eburnea]|uniref:4715_t:CDS:1 n=1 Tax=Diversispora eburnea TaxID=1213867 RepID=A0A9N8YHW7_9GLOM|nr:4715_t:CDS:2 [Diversispora eburnea]
MYSEQNYPGYEALITYLTRSRNKSFLGFLRRCRDVIVATTSATSRWVDLDHTWAVRFISEAGKLGDDLEEKVGSERERRAKKLEDYWNEVIYECKLTTYFAFIY